MIAFPDDTQRHTIIGRTGSGKTIAALFALSNRSYDRMPWIIYNFKRDENIDGIPGAYDIELDELPAEPGVYITHPLPKTDDDAVEAQMRAIWHRGHTGIYVDEGHMIDRSNAAFRHLLIQGRSKRVPIIMLSQRPSWIDKFVLSESDFFQVFHLNNRMDRKQVADFMPVNLERKIPRFHSWYYNVSDDSMHLLKPVPPIEHIHRTFDSRLRKLRKVV